MSTRPSARKVRSTYEFIKAHRDQYSVETMCRFLGVARSGYYKWLNEPISSRAHQDARLLRLIRASFIASQGIYDAPKSTKTRRPSARYEHELSLSGGTGGPADDLAREQIHDDGQVEPPLPRCARLQKRAANIAWRG
jgi:hypothetical protein